MEALLSLFALFTTGSFCTNDKFFAIPLLKMNLSLHTLGTEGKNTVINWHIFMTLELFYLQKSNYSDQQHPKGGMLFSAEAPLWDSVWCNRHYFLFLNNNT